MTSGRRLLSPRGLTTRPTTARVREAVMNILAPRLEGCRWLDLCSGSGVMGCEALERGASNVTAVDQDHHCAQISQRNLISVAKQFDNCPEIQVIRRNMLNWLRQGWTADPFDLIYFDPPYNADLYQSALTLIGQGGWLVSNGLLICEHRSGDQPSEIEGWQLLDQRRYGMTSLLLLSPPEHCHRADTDSKQQQKAP